MDCLRIDGVKKSMKKLDNKIENDEQVIGDVIFQDNRGNENRYTYKYEGKIIFTFGFTRGSKVKETKLSYVPRQMRLTNSEYKRFHDCTMSKSQYNEYLKNIGLLK